jgi:hypothetical protein
MHQSHQTRRVGRRTILINIAAILLFLLGGVQLTLAISEYFRTAFGALAPLEGNSSAVWGSVDVLFALALIYAGYALLRWRLSGRTIALLIAVLLAFRWANYLVKYSWVSVTLVAVCGLIIAALAWSDDSVAPGGGSQRSM